MRRAVATVIGLAAAGVFTYALLHVMDIGTCASGGPYVSARPCPSGTAGSILMLTASLFVVVIAILAGGGLLVWAGLFLISGIGMLTFAISAHNPGPGARLAAYAVGIVFVLMGGIPLIYLGFGAVAEREERRRRARGRVADATVCRVEPLGATGARSERLRVSYAVHPSDDVSFEVSRETTMLPASAPRVGERVQVRYDPDRRDEFDVVRPSSGPTGARGAVRDGAAVSAYGGTVAGARDPLDRLKELADLRAAGALTDSEFAVQKARILAES